MVGMDETRVAANVSINMSLILGTEPLHTRNVGHIEKMPDLKRL
jgi:hypothetical protein